MIFKVQQIPELTESLLRALFACVVCVYIYPCVCAVCVCVLRYVIREIRNAAIRRAASRVVVVRAERATSYC